MRTLVLILTVFSVTSSFGQTWQEWTQQKKTKIKYLLEQIAAVRVYANDLQKGYQIAQSGLKTIQEIKNGEFNIHFSFVDSLSKVNPRIKTYARIGDIIFRQVHIVKSTREVILFIRETKQFSESEIQYCESVFRNLINECLANVDELTTIVTDGKLTMKDDERLMRIDRLYSAMLEKDSFNSSFGGQMALLCAQRLNEKADMEISKQINGMQ